MNTETIEAVRTVKFFNISEPGIKIFIKQDPNYDKLVNKNLAQDTYVEFAGGWAESSDPEVIEILNSPKLRAKGIRCLDNLEDMAEFGSVEEKRSYMEQEVERRVQETLEHERASNAHAAASPFLASPEQAAESVSPRE